MEISIETTSQASAKDSQSGEGTTTATEGSGRRDGKEEEVIFNRDGLATMWQGHFC